MSMKEEQERGRHPSGICKCSRLSCLAHGCLPDLHLLAGLGWSKHPSIIPCQHQPGPSLSPALVSLATPRTLDTGHSRVSPHHGVGILSDSVDQQHSPPRPLVPDTQAQVSPVSWLGSPMHPAPAHHMIQPRLVPNNFAFYVPVYSVQ